MNLPFEELKASERLPSPSGVALEILRLTQNPDISIDDLLKPVQSDPALAGRLLQIANSALHGHNGAVVSVRNALINLGTNSLTNLALSLSLLDSNRLGSCNAFDYDLFWSSSLLRAVAIKLLALKRPDTDTLPDEAFTIGLLAEIGRLALAQVYPLEYALCLQKSQSDLLELERESFLITHQQITIEMLRGWGLPERVLNPLIESWSISSNIINDEPAGVFATQLRLASYLAGEHGINSGIAELPSLMKTLNLNFPELEHIRRQLFLEWQHWGELLSIPVDTTVFKSMGTSPDPLDDQLKILVVEDDRTQALILSTHLKQQGHKVFVANNGNQALQQVMLARPDIIITDYQMEQMNGLSLTSTLRTNLDLQSIYVILITADKSPALMTAAFDAGVNDFISKPIRHDELDARVLGARYSLKLHLKFKQEQEIIRQRSFELATEKRRIQLVAITDPLTELPNRRYASARLNQEWAAFQRHGRPFAILSLDLDKFKEINDLFGHDTGDIVLKHFANVLRQTIRSEDIACRMGGEEFIVIAPNTNTETARILCERICLRVEKQQPDSLKLLRLVTVSIGAAVSNLALAEGNEGWNAILKLSDLALYHAKSAGRNTFKIYDDYV